METIDNDSPRQPVWPGRIKAEPVKKNAPAPEIRVVPKPRRCICGARPNPAGVLPCDH